MIGDSKIRWHRAKAWDAYPYWYAELDGVRIAEAVNTSATGTDNYPWDWHITAEGLPLRNDRAVRQARAYGVMGTLGEVKSYIAEQLA